MALARVASQIAGNQTSIPATSVSCAYPGNVTSGNLLVVCVAWDSEDDPSGGVTKLSGTATVGTFVLDGTVSVTGQQSALIYSAPVTGTGSLTVECYHSSSKSWVIGVQEYSGADITASRVDGTAKTGTGTGTTASTATQTSAAGAVFVGSCSVWLGNSTLVPVAGNNFTEIYKQANGSLYMTGGCMDRIVSESTADIADWTIGQSVNWSAVCVMYKAVPAAVPDQSGRMAVQQRMG